MDAAAGFDNAFKAVARSKVYAEAVHAAIGGLPEWLVPYSVTSLDDLQRIASEAGLRSGLTLVDLACGLGGPGIWLAEHTGVSLVGVDFSPAAVNGAIQLATERGLHGRTQFIQADATATDLPHETADALMCLDAFPFIDHVGAAREIARLLKVGATAVIRTWEALVDDLPLRTMVTDCRPIFAEAGLALRCREELAGSQERELAFHRAIVQRADALTEELGAEAEPLLEEARYVLARAKKPPRVRKMLYVVER